MKSDDLTDQEKTFWNANGYIIIKQAVSKKHVDETIDVIWDFLEMDRSMPSDWYDEDKRNRSGIDFRGMIPLYNHQALWNCRQSEQIYRVFSGIYNCRELLVSIDRVNMNPPNTNEWNYQGFIHWDIDVSTRPLPFQLQGLLSLTESQPGAGGFQCVPGFHLHIEKWLSKQLPGYNSRFPDITGMSILQIPMNAGDFIIWHGALPHGNTENKSTTPRLAQYITMIPETQMNKHEKDGRINSFKTNGTPVSPQGKPFPNSPKPTGNEHEVQLSSLGRRLLGMDNW